MRSLRSIIPGAACLVLLACLEPVHAQYGTGLYKNGQLIDTFGPVAPAANAAPKAFAAGAAGFPVPSTAVAPVISAETQARNQLFTDATLLGIQIQDTLRQMQNSGLGTNAAQSGAAPPPIASLLQQLMAKQTQVRAAFDAIGAHLIELKLPLEILERHTNAVAINEAGFAAFANAVGDVVAGKPGAVDVALKLLNQVKLRDEPDLSRRGPTHQPMTILSAPTLALEQANPLPGNQSKAAAKPNAGGPIKPNLSPPTPSDLAETPDVQLTSTIHAKAASLGNSPEAIYEFVRNNVKFQPYLGSRKGADFTLRQMTGNDTDQASLLIALLRAANIPCRYVRGTVEMTPTQAASWLGVDDFSTAASLLSTAGLDGAFYGGNVRCTHVWVEAYVPYSNYRGVPNDDMGKTWIPLDPAFKLTTVAQGEDVLTAMGYTNDTFLAGYVSTYNSNSPIQALRLNVQNWLNTNRPGKKVADIARTIATQSQNLGLLPASLPVNVVAASDVVSSLDDTNRFKIRFNLYNGGTTFINFTTNLCQLVGHQVTISYIGATTNDQAVINAYGGVFQTPPYLVNVKPVLKVDGNPVAAATSSIGMGYVHNSDMYFTQPVGDQNVQPAIYNNITAGNSQAIGFDTFMDVPNLFLADTNSDSLLVNLLNSTALDYLSRVDRGEEDADGLLRTVHTVDVSEAILESSVSVLYSFGGVPQTFTWTGMIVDADRRIVGPFGANGDSSKELPFMKLTGYDGSFMENDVFEDTYLQRAVSTIRILQWSHDQGIPTCYISNSIAAACPGFNHSFSVLSAVNSALASGHIVIIPRQDITVGQWSGTGYIDLNPATGAAGYIISGGISGGIMASGGATVDVWPINLGCTPIGTVTGTITPNGFAAGAKLCADSSQITYTVTLQYDCKDAQGNITHKTFGPTPHTIPMTKRDIVRNFGPGVYTISIPGTAVAPVSFTLVYVEFTKREDATCWQRNGTYDAKALLSADSTKDDSLLAWTITPNDATISAVGVVTFGSGGNKYTVKATPGGLASCADTLTLSVVQVTNITVSTKPANRSRTDIGVGEEVNLSMVPAIAGATWSASAGAVSPVTAPSTTFTAGDTVGNSVITVQFPAGSCAKTFTVVAPTTVVQATVAGTESYPKNVQGAGMHLFPVIVGPITVSFYRLQIIEVGENANSITGYFTSNAPISHIGHGADVWFALGQDNAWPANWDYATLYQYPPPWSAGGFTWNIPSKWRIGAAGTEHAMTGWNQVFSLSGPAGTTTIRKFSHGVTRTTNDVSTTF